MRTNKQWKDSRANSHRGLAPHPTEVQRADWEARPCLELADKPIHPREQLLPTSPGPGCVLKTLGRESGSPDGCRCLGLLRPQRAGSPARCQGSALATFLRGNLQQQTCFLRRCVIQESLGCCGFRPPVQSGRPHKYRGGLLLLASVMNRKKKASASPTQWAGI